MPELDTPPSPEEVEAILADVSEPEEIRILKTDEERQVAAKIIPILAGRANALAEANKAKELNKTLEELRARNAEMVESELQKIRAATKPPDLKQIEKLLNQDYMEVVFKLRTSNKEGSREREFVIRELPQIVEERFLRIVQRNLMPRLKEFASIEWTNTNTVAEKIQRVIDIFPEALQTMADLAAVALDPFQEDDLIDGIWVKNHLGSYRIMMLIQAQVEAGRFRDFFVQLYQAIPGQRMTA